MPDREHEELERELRELGSRIDYPPVPDVSRRVKLRLDAEAGEHPRPYRWLRTFTRPWWAAAAAATVLLFLSVLSPAMRSTFSDIVSSGTSGGAGKAAGGPGGSDGLGASSAEYATQTPPPPVGTAGSTEASAGAAASAAPSPGSALGFGARIPLSEASAMVEELLLPRSPKFTGGPGAVYAAGPDEADGVVVLFGSEPGLPPLGSTDAGLILAESASDTQFDYSVGDDAYGPAEEVDVGGARGYWVPDGRSLRPQPGDAEELSGGAPVWERGGVALLMRADVTREEAIRIAETVR